REEDDAREPEPVTEPPGEHGCDHVASGHGAEQRVRDRLRLAETLDDVEDDEGARGRERPLPRRVRNQKAPHLWLAGEDRPAPPEVRSDALEDAAVTAVLAHEDDGRAARTRGHERGEDERARGPHLQQPTAADERGAESNAAQHV